MSRTSDMFGIARHRWISCIVSYCATSCDFLSNRIHMMHSFERVAGCTAKMALELWTRDDTGELLPRSAAPLVRAVGWPVPFGANLIRAHRHQIP